MTPERLSSLKVLLVSFSFAACELSPLLADTPELPRTPCVGVECGLACIVADPLLEPSNAPVGVAAVQTGGQLPTFERLIVPEEGTCRINTTLSTFDGDCGGITGDQVLLGNGGTVVTVVTPAVDIRGRFEVVGRWALQIFSDEISIAGEVRAAASGPDFDGPGANDTMACNGSRGREPNDPNGGGGGGGHLIDGGRGGGMTPASGGVPRGHKTIVPLAGGCAGGAGSGSRSGAGGGGGGAVQLVAPTITISGSILATGGGGAGGAGRSGGGGGGSGGAILIEGDRVDIVAGARLLAAGGGGGEGGDDTDVRGAPGLDGAAMPPLGGRTLEQGGAGGDGAISLDSALDGAAGAGGGGGGGAMGRIRINAASVVVDLEHESVPRLTAPGPCAD